jgi:hypothetical protein
MYSHVSKKIIGTLTKEKIAEIANYSSCDNHFVTESSASKLSSEDNEKDISELSGDLGT